MPWTDTEPPERDRQALQLWWRNRVNFRITRERWAETRTDMQIEISGFHECVDLFALKS